MDTLYGWLIFAAFIGVVLLWQKGVKAASKTLNQKVLYRSEHKEGQELVAQLLTFETPASVAEIMAALDAMVPKAPQRPGILAEIYELNRDQNHIVYAMGNAVYPKMVVAVVTLTPMGNCTKCEYQIHNWRERDGLVVDQEVIKGLRKHVKAAFEAADDKARNGGSRQTVRIDENNTAGVSVGEAAISADEQIHDSLPAASASVAQSIAADPQVRYCYKCGSKNKVTNTFCNQCGSRMRGIALEQAAN